MNEYQQLVFLKEKQEFLSLDYHKIHICPAHCKLGRANKTLTVIQTDFNYAQY